MLALCLFDSPSISLFCWLCTLIDIEHNSSAHKFPLHNSFWKQLVGNTFKMFPSIQTRGITKPGSLRIYDEYFLCLNFDSLRVEVITSHKLVPPTTILMEHSVCTCVAALLESDSSESKFQMWFMDVAKHEFKNAILKISSFREMQNQNTCTILENYE